MLTAFGEQLTAQLLPQAAWRMDYGATPNTRFISTTGTANGGSVAIDQSRASLQTGTADNGAAVMSSKKSLRYLNGYGGLMRMTAAFNAPVADSKQFIGIGDTLDGFFFGYQDTQFGILRRRAGVEYFTPSSDWNAYYLNFSPQLGNIYQIRFQYLGYGYIRFYVLDPIHEENGFRLHHTIRYPNTNNLTHILNPTLPLRAEITNTGNTSNLTLYTPSAVAAVEGVYETPHNPLDLAGSTDAAVTFADTNNNHILTIRNKATYGGVANRIPVRISGINMSRAASGAPTSTVRLYKNATTAGTRTYADYDTDNSPVDISSTTTTVSAGTAFRTYTVTDASTARDVVFTNGELVLSPGESLTIAAQNSGVQSTAGVAGVNWVEQF